jgi:hypothetical protein
LIFFVGFFIWMFLPLCILPWLLYWLITRGHDNLAVLVGIACVIGTFPWYAFASENGPFSLMKTLLAWLRQER